MKNILFFGDSLTAGYGIANPDNESLPGLIRQKINAEGLDYNVINAGLSGDTSGGGLNRLDYWLSSKVDAFVSELGINDAIRRVSPSRTYDNLKAIIEKVKAKYPEAKIALMGMQLPTIIPGGEVHEFRILFKKLADDYHIAFVPFFLEGVAGRKHLNLPDGLHPSAAGYKVIAEKLWPLIKTLL
jgi:acyl-CoA thioesterase-1